MNNSDDTWLVPHNAKTYSNERARELFGHAVFEFLVPDGPLVEIAWKGQPADAKFTLTMKTTGDVVCRCFLDHSQLGVMHWPKDALDE